MYPLTHPAWAASVVQRITAARASLVSVLIVLTFLFEAVRHVGGARRLGYVRSREQSSPTRSQMSAGFLQLCCTGGSRAACLPAFFRNNPSLAATAIVRQTLGVDLPDLRALQQGDENAWDEAFRWLWPAVFAVSKLKLEPFLPDAIEDVALEALEVLVEKVRDVKAVEELKPLAASIAHHRAVSLLRERFAKKRGEGKTESLDVSTDEGRWVNEPVSEGSPLSHLEQKELAERLRRSLAELKPPAGQILQDFFLHGLRYEEIAKKHGIAVGSVGVYLKRGLEAMRRIWGRNESI
ncbi:MAG: RNA polymerase sigma factor [Limisphaerales bacterium]